MTTVVETTDFDRLHLKKYQKVRMKDDIFSIAQQHFAFCRFEHADAYRGIYEKANGKETEIVAVDNRTIDGTTMKIYGIKNCMYIIHPDMIQSIFVEEEIEIDCKDLI